MLRHQEHSPAAAVDLDLMNSGLKLGSLRNLLLTDTRASSGHSWNQSMAVQLTTAGNLLARTRRVEPTGEKQRTTWGRTAVAQWGVLAARLGTLSLGAPCDCRDSAAG
ncbi:hypothetical protein Nmel_016434 [Mimus melanotis]